MTPKFFIKNNKNYISQKFIFFLKVNSLIFLIELA